MPDLDSFVIVTVPGCLVFLCNLKVVRGLASKRHILVLEGSTLSTLFSVIASLECF